MRTSFSVRFCSSEQLKYSYFIIAGRASTDQTLTVKYSRRDVDERVSNGIRSGLGQAKKLRLFEQTEVGIALVCGEAASGGDKASASCGFGRNWRRAV